MFKKFFLYSFLLFLFWQNLSYAVGRGPGARAAGMGGAYSAIAEGIESIAWNPAGMAGTRFSSNLSAGGNLNLTLQEAQNLFNKLKTTQGRSDYLAENILKEIKIYGLGHLPFGFSLGNFGIAALGSAYALANKGENDFNFLLLGAYELDYGIIYGDSLGSFFFPLKDLFWGVAIRRYSGEGRFLVYVPNLVIINDQLKTVAIEGSSVISNGVAGDLGLKYIFADRLVVALAVKDIATSYDQKIERNYREVDFTNRTIGSILATEEVTSKETGKSRWTLGLAYLLAEWGFLVSLDVDHYPTTSVLISDADFGKESEVTDFHLGLEKEIFNWLFFRCGGSSENLGKIQESWFTYGLGLKLGTLHFDLAAGNSSKTWQAYVESGLSF